MMMAAALKFGGLLWLCLAGANPVLAEPHLPSVPEQFIHTCEDLEKVFSFELTGTTAVLGKLSCDPPLMMDIRDHAVLLSDDVLEFQGIYFRLPATTRLTIAAPAVKIHDSTAGSRQPLFFVEGQLDFRVTSWTPSLTSGSMEDEHHKLNVVGQGVVSSDGIMKFTDTSLYVGKQAAQQATGDKPEEAAPSPADAPKTSELSTATTDAAIDPTASSKDDEDVSDMTKDEIGLAAYIVYRNYIESIQENDKMVSTAHQDDLASDGRESLDKADGMEAKPTGEDGPAGDLTATKEDDAELPGSVDDTSVGVPQPRVVVSPAAGPSDNSASDLSAMVEDSVELAGDVDDTSAGGAELEAETSPASAEKATIHDVDDRAAITAAAASADPTSSPAQGTTQDQAFKFSIDVIDSVIDDIMASFPGGVFSGESDSASPTPEPKVKGADKDGETTPGDGDEAPSTSSPHTILPVHPESSLKPGQRLSGRLRSMDGSASIYASVKDGSVLHEKSEGEGPSFDLDGQTATSTSSVTRTLISSNPRKLAKALRIREDTVEEDNAIKLADAGEGGTGGKVVAKVMSWMPFGKNGFIRRNQRKNARKHMGEVDISITARGNVQVSMDGTTVLKKGGPSLLGFRAKDPSYELRTTTEGLEIWRAGQLDWTVELMSF